MSQLPLCRLCINACEDHESLYYANGKGNELYKKLLEYFHPKIVDMDEAKHLIVICAECFVYICDFHSFQKSVSVAQLKLIKLDSVKTEQDDISDVIQHPQNLHHILDNEEEFMSLSEEETDDKKLFVFPPEVEMSKCPGNGVEEFMSLSEEETDEKKLFVFPPEVEMSKCPGNGVSNLVLAEESEHSSMAPICTIFHVPAIAWNKTEFSAQSELNVIDVPDENRSGSDDKDAVETLYAADPCSKYTNEATAENEEDENMDISQPQLELKDTDSTTATVGSAPKGATKANEEIVPVEASNEANIQQADAGERFESNLCDNRHMNRQHIEAGKMPTRNAKRESVTKEAAMSAKNVIESGKESKHLKTRRTQGNREANRETLTRVSLLDAVSDHTYAQCDGKDDDIANEWKCHICGKAFACEKYVRRHLVTHHPETQAGYKYVYDEASKTFKCILCGNGFVCKGNLTSHMSRQHGELANRNALPFKCRLCGNSFAQQNNLTKHVKRQHPEIAPDYDYDATTKRYKCKLCDNNFSQKNNLSRHVKRVHDGISKNGAGNIDTTEHITCNLCDCYYTHINGFNSHMKKKHPEAVHGTINSDYDYDGTTTKGTPLSVERHPAEAYHCKECGKTFNNYLSWCRHTYNHRLECRYKCKTCGKGFKFATLLRYHLATHVPTKSFKCKLCGKYFKRNSTLSLHIRSQHSDNNFQTVDNVPPEHGSADNHPMDGSTKPGGNALEEPSTLRRLRRHKCTVCSKIFKTARALHRHHCVDMRRGNKRRANSAGAKMNRSTGRDLKTIKRT